MNLKEVKEEITMLTLIYEYIDVYKNDNEEYQVVFNGDGIHFRISFDKEKCGGYLASVNYVSQLGKYYHRTNNKADLDLFMAMV